MEKMSELLKLRREKLNDLAEEGINPFPNDFRVIHTSQEIRERFKQIKAEELDKLEEEFSVAGRIMSIRNFGKASFIHIKDRKGEIQAYIQKGVVSDDDFKLFKKLDIGDFAGIKGRVFLTRTQELTIKANQIKLLVKSLRPLPEKWHGLSNIETRYRQRYLDLLMNPEVKDIFYKRAKIIQMIRAFLQEREFLEVETPMMQPIPGGAAARPFKTHHNTFNLDLYLRISPELYLKRLLVGGVERVYEINRNFRNEGISTQHNPEFTMLEFYQSYATYEDLMGLTEEMICHITQQLSGTLKIPYLDNEIDFTPPWQKLSMKQAIIKYGKIEPHILEKRDLAFKQAQKVGLSPSTQDGLGIIVNDLFEEVVQHQLIEPTFVTSYPTETSPLARRNDINSAEVDRFELFINGQEIANAFSELNDPTDQRERFLKQLSSSESDEETGKLDEDFIQALEYGMPPAAGEGIGIDRLVMLLCNSASIRDVILFPLLKPER
ncbi:MAG: lysine--tRNA ligase [Deltaproteobacteria bacterium]|jgi:lysyl-tRNA synthetase class 2|nr:lysine--tRNA ligase [Deltaproteobacteria bacterium]MCK5513314.1 lysine--tRNA ligase [Deltaproteobacteria bacterium]